LLPFRPQPIRKVCQVDGSLSTLFSTSFQGLKLILKDRLGIMQQSPDQSALSVVNASASRKSKQFNGFAHGSRFRWHQK
jgi:hypothetical protein